MLLTFSKTEFKDRIKKGIKIHTIREDKHNRWKQGMNIHFWLGNPRNTRSKSKPYQFGTGICELVLPIHIYPDENMFIIGDQGEFKTIGFLNELAENDGFDSWVEMKQWFKEEFHGKIIYWKNFELTANDDGNTVF